jgi:hypothetical protein
VRVVLFPWTVLKLDIMELTTLHRCRTGSRVLSFGVVMHSNAEAFLKYRRRDLTAVDYIYRATSCIVTHRSSLRDGPCHLSVPRAQTIAMHI